MTNGIILKGIGGFYYVQTDLGIIQCKAMGRLRKENITPVTGDMVKIRISEEDPKEGAIEEIAKRKNSLMRPPVANVDAIAVVISTANPKPDFLMVDKLIATAEYIKIRIIIVVNKIDIASGDEIINIYKKAGFETVKTCSQTNEGIDELKSMMTDRITSFAGNSGVGKTSILNCFGFDLLTGDVSKINRGKHTTRHSELLPFKQNRYVIDTPGFSLLEITSIRSNQLKDYFREFARFENCRFADCIHIGAKPNICGVGAALEKGEICHSRYKSYMDVYNDLKDIKEWEK
ncbi:MAG: ribosome small subunit-dependent GTPase A [Clostridiaceae bacterium]|nr:ribosome small subunit-dependent GTPase A [Clostridiaceae bacterium]